jgi:hypothetical protein
MTRVCLVGDEDLQLSYELLSRETARDALAAYDLREPYHNTVAVETVSLGAAVALLNDLEWYLVRFAREVMVFEPSVSGDEWLSRALATAIRDGECDPTGTGRLLKIYGLSTPDGEIGDESTDGETGGESTDGEMGGESADGQDQESVGSESSASRDGESSASGDDEASTSTGGPTGPPRLVEPMFVARTGGSLPEYDLRDVAETLHVRVTEDEFER